MRSRTAFAMVGWLVAAVVATVAGLGAVRVIGDGITATAATTLSQDEVAEALASSAPSTSPPPTASPSPSPRPEPSATTPAGTLLKHTGGQVMAHCEGGLVRLDWWVAQPGYQVIVDDRGPSGEAEITFDRGGKGHGSGKIELRIGCRGGTPEITRVDD